MTDTILHSYRFIGTFPVIFVQPGLDSIVRDPATPEEIPFGEVWPGDIVATSQLLSVDALHQYEPADDATVRATALLQAVEPTVEEEAPEPSPGTPPMDRSVAFIVAWIGDDLERARQVAALEAAAPEPRKTLTDALERFGSTGQES